MTSRHIDLVAIGLLLFSIAVYSHVKSFVRIGVDDAQRSLAMGRVQQRVWVMRAVPRAPAIPCVPAFPRIHLTRD